MSKWCRGHCVYVLSDTISLMQCLQVTTHNLILIILYLCYIFNPQITVDVCRAQWSQRSPVAFHWLRRADLRSHLATLCQVVELVFLVRTISVLLSLDWLIVQCFTSPPTQYRLYGRRFLQVKRPIQQHQSTEGTNSTQTNQTYNKQTWTQNTASPLVYTNMGWLGDSSHRGQGCMAWMAVGL